MKLHFEWRPFCIGITIAMVIAYVINMVAGLGFWLPFAVTIGVMLTNGLLADWEDNQPGGFNRPLPPEQDKHTDP